MDRSTTAPVVCLLLVTSMAVAAVPAGSADGPTAPGAVAAQAPPTPTNNTTARLVLPAHRVTQWEFRTVRLGAGSALQSSAGSVRSQHERLTLRRKFRNATTAEARRDIIIRALIDLERRAVALEARERYVIDNYSDGNVSSEALVRRLAAIDARARQIDATLTLLREFRDRAAAPWLESRIRTIEGLVEPRQGPVRRLATRVLSGETAPQPIYVVAAEEGVVLSALSEDRYLREATYYRNRDADAPRELQNIVEATARARELYPWVASETSGDRAQGLLKQTFRYSTVHPQGELTAYIDASTSDVYREIQTLSVDAMPATTTTDWTEGGLRLTLRRTYAGGPMKLLVERPGTDTVVNAVVTVDGRELGRVGTVGRAVTIEPRPPYTVAVTFEGTSFNVTVERPIPGTPGE